jgi:hypothetical protein
MRQAGERLVPKGSRRLRAVQAAGPAADSGSIGHPIGVLQRGRSIFPRTVLYETSPERLSASQKAIMRIGEREQREEGEGPPAKLANPPSDPNPVVVFIVRLLVTAAVTDDGIAFTKRT